MYDNPTLKNQPRIEQLPHIEFAHSTVLVMCDLPLDQQNEVLTFLFNAIKERRKAEVSMLRMNMDEAQERIGTIQHIDGLLAKEMEACRLSV